MDPWPKVDYSRHIRDASMAMEGLPEVVPPSGRVPGQRLLAAPILKRRRQRNREEIGKRGSLPRVFSSGAKYRRKGVVRGATRGPDAPWARPHPWPRHQGAWALVGPLRLPLDYSGSFWCADFLYIFPGSYWAL